MSIFDILLSNPLTTLLPAETQYLSIRTQLESLIARLETRCYTLCPQPICLTQKHITLAQNLPGSKLVYLRQCAYALIIDWHAKFQSRNHALQCSYEPFMIHLCFFSLSVTREKYYTRENRLYSLNSICTCSTLKSCTCHADVQQSVVGEYFHSTCVADDAYHYCLYALVDISNRL